MRKVFFGIKLTDFEFLFFFLVFIYRKIFFKYNASIVCSERILKEIYKLWERGRRVFWLDFERRDCMQLFDIHRVAICFGIWITNVCPWRRLFCFVLLFLPFPFLPKCTPHKRAGLELWLSALARIETLKISIWKTRRG